VEERRILTKTLHKLRSIGVSSMRCGKTQDFYENPAQTQEHRRSYDALWYCTVGTVRESGVENASHFQKSDVLAQDERTRILEPDPCQSRLSREGIPLKILSSGSHPWGCL